MADQSFSNLLSVYFRISDGGKPVEKCCSKEICFINFYAVFRGYDITVVADNCKPETLSFLNSFKDINVIETNTGGIESYFRVLSMAMASNKMFAYFSEHDYIHRDEAPRLIVEGLRWGNYISLYDHPDKYIKERGYGEVGRCLKTESWHWRQTISTTLTFGANVKILSEDLDIFKKNVVGPTTYNDHNQWVDLSKKKRSLLVSIPGAAFNTHRECEHSGFDWGAGWAGPQMHKAVAMVTSNILQQPPEDIEFKPAYVSTPENAAALPPDASKPAVGATPGLPDLMALGRTQVPLRPTPQQTVVERQPQPVEETPSKIRKKTAVKPAVAIPNVEALHEMNKKKKDYELVDAQFGAFVET